MSPPAPPERCDVAVVGGGILGLATARELLQRRPGLQVAVLEAGSEVGGAQTRWNSGVVHAGIYYPPGSLKAQLCVEGARLLYEYCDGRGIPAQRCGKVIVAVGESELAGLEELERRGRANGVPGLRRVDAAGLRELEPHATGVAALHSPATGIVDFSAVARSFAEDIVRAGGSVTTSTKATDLEHGPVRIVHSSGETVARFALFCAGAFADRLALRDGADPDPRIVPFRGTYLRLRPERRELVRSLIYPVPDPRLPFLGVHLTRHPREGVLIGPTALLVPRVRSFAWPGTWRLMARFWRTGIEEMRHAASRRSLVKAARRFVPELGAGDVEPAFSGERAQALGRDGTLVDDFRFSETDSALHIRNAPSPAATSSLAIARHIADRIEASGVL